MAEEKNMYNVIMSYDVLKGGEKNDCSDFIVILCIFIIIVVICGAAYAAYYFLYKKKYAKDKDLMEGINDVHLSMADTSKSGLITDEEGIIE